MSRSRAATVVAILATLTELVGQREEPVRCVLTERADGLWTYELETRKAYGPDGRITRPELAQADLAVSLIDGSNEWHLDIGATPKPAPDDFIRWVPDVPAISDPATEADTEEPQERPGVIAANPEEVRQRVEQARAAAAAGQPLTPTPTPGIEDTDDGLDDLPF